MLVATGLYESTAVHVLHTSVVGGVLDLAYLTPEDESIIEKSLEKKYNVELVPDDSDSKLVSTNATSSEKQIDTTA